MLENLNLGGSPSTVDILKRLLNSKDIELKTHVEIEQIQVLTQLKWFELCDTFPDRDPFNNMAAALNYYLQLMTSLDRKSREEIISAISEMKKPEFRDNPIINDLKK